MSRGRIQLASVGIQDEFLTGDPQITYFLKNFKRHLKKSMDDYLGRGYSEEELQASYRGKYGIEMCDESLPLELFTERVEDTASSIIEKRRKEELRKLTEEVVYAA